MATKSYAVKSGSAKNKQNTRDAIAAREDFQTGGAMRAETDLDGTYRVYSYGAIIAQCNKYGEWVKATHKYSVTTTSHQSAVSQAFYQNSIVFTEVDKIESRY